MMARRGDETRREGQCIESSRAVRVSPGAEGVAGHTQPAECKRGAWRELLFALCCAGLLGDCASREAVGTGALSVVSAGVINDPGNKSLRFDVLKFGMDELCKEMLARGAPLKLSDGEPVLGRFFADGCDAQVVDADERQSVIVRYVGKGYAWTQMSGRLGFASTGLVEYAADFQVHDEQLYIYFRPKSVGSVSFQPVLVESALARIGLGLTGIDAESLGRDIVSRQLQRGFTVIRHSARGDSEFGAGVIAKGERPFRPFQVRRSDRRTLDNDRTVVQPGQQDYIGGIVLTESPSKVHLTLSLTGAAAVDVLLLRDSDARAMLAGYVHESGARSPVAQPVLEMPLMAGQPLSTQLTLPSGRYVLLLDNSAAAGRLPPAPSGLAGVGATVDYLVQIDP